MLQRKQKQISFWIFDLVQCGIFNMIEVSFLPVGHIHEDIDQFFSRIAMYLHYYNAITESQLLEAVANSMIPNPIVLKFDNIANMKQYMIQENWLNPLSGFIILLKF